MWFQVFGIWFLVASILRLSNPVIRLSYVYSLSSAWLTFLFMLARLCTIKWTLELWEGWASPQENPVFKHDEIASTWHSLRNDKITIESSFFTQFRWEWRKKWGDMKIALCQSSKRGVFACLENLQLTFLLLPDTWTLTSSIDWKCIIISGIRQATTDICSYYKIYLSL